MEPRHFRFEIAFLSLPLLAVVMAAVDTVGFLVPVATGRYLIVFCATPFAAMLFGAAVSTLPNRTVRVVVLTLLVTPLASGCAPGTLAVLSFTVPTAMFEWGVVASLPILLGVLPTAIACARIGRSPAGTARRRAAVRTVWLVAAMTLACGASFTWSPPQAEPSDRARFAAVLWTPPPATWLDELRSTASTTSLVLCACGVTILAVMLLDWRERLRLRARRTSARPAAKGPYRQDHHGMAFAEEDALAALDRAVRRDFVCGALAACAAILFVARIRDLESNLDVIGVTHDDRSRSLAVPSLRWACAQVRPSDGWATVNERLSGYATYERIGADGYRWRRHPSYRSQGSFGSCSITFDDRDGYSPRVRTAEYRGEI